MKSEFYVKIAARKSGYGVKRWQFHGIPKVSRNKPPVAVDEVAVKVEIEIPDAYFEEPSLEVKIAVPSRRAPLVVTSSIEKAISEAIRQQIGMKVHVTCEKPDDENVTGGK